jgi:FkbM family methyltransferase
MRVIKALIQGFLGLFGLRLSRVAPIRVQELRDREEYERIAEIKRKKIRWLKDMAVNTVLDIGANTGQFAKHIREIFPDAMIYSFEPLADCYEDLLTNFKDQPKYQAFNVALGDETAQKNFYRNEFSPSSSFLPMADLHKKNFPYTEKEHVERVEVIRLDDIAKTLNIKMPILVKIDVQGFEDNVIRGGECTISKADIIIIELSIDALYKDQPLFDDIYRTLLNLGFQYRGNYDQLCSPDNGKVLQVDGIFIKKILP